jgi:flagellin-specific chaperone FliS
MAIAHIYAKQYPQISNRWSGDLPIASYREATKLINTALAMEHDWELLVLSAQKIFLKLLISPPGGGIGQRLAQIHENLYDKLSHAYLVKDRFILGEVIWTLRDITEYCSNLAGNEDPNQFRIFGGIL